MKLSQAIINGRFHAGRMSQEELAARVHVTRQTIGKIENEKTEPSWSLVKLIATVLGISLDSLTL